MTCNLQWERVALYVNDDLPETDRHSVEEHLRDCESCARLASAYREESAAIARSVAAVTLPSGLSQPLPSRRPAWPTSAAAAAVVACVLLVLQIPVVAERLQMLGATMVSRERLDETVKQIQEHRFSYGPPAALSTLEEAAQKYHGPLAVPSYLPEGYRLKRVITYGDGPVERVKQEYVMEEPNSTLVISQQPAREQVSVSYLDGAQPVVVKVNSGDAYVVEQVVQMKNDGSYEVKDDQHRELVFEWEGQIVSIHTFTTYFPRTIERLSVAELVRIAESMKP